MMSDPEWFLRLKAAIDADPRSARQLSIDSDLRPTFVSHLLRDKKEPLITNFMKLCDGLGVSPLSIAYGVDADPEAERFLRIFEAASPKRRRAILDFLSDKTN